MLKYMLDTNIVIYTMKNKPASVKAALVKHYGQTSISSITMMELAYGAEKSANPERNLNVLEGFAARPDKTEIIIGIAVRRRIPVAVRGTQIPRIIVPRAAANI